MDLVWEPTFRIGSSFFFILDFCKPKPIKPKPQNQPLYNPLAIEENTFIDLTSLHPLQTLSQHMCHLLPGPKMYCMNHLTRASSLCAWGCRLSVWLLYFCCYEFYISYRTLCIVLQFHDLRFCIPFPSMNRIPSWIP